MAFEAYAVAVRLSLVSNVASGLAALSTQFGKLNSDVNAARGSLSQLESKLLNIKRMGLVGGAMAGAGFGALSLFKAPLDEAKEFQTEIQKFRALGVGEQVTADAEKFAKGMNTYGTSVRENLSLLRDAQTIFGDFEHAKFVTPMLSQMKFANAALYGAEGGAMRDRAFMDMLKVIELRKGLSSEAAFKTQANMVQQVQTATGGRVGPEEYLNLIKTGGVAAKSLKDDVFYYKMEPLIQEMGGNRIGTGLMSAYSNLILGRTTVQTAKELQRLGLLDPKHIEYNKIGMIKRILPGGLKGGDLMMQDPMEFLEKVLLPSFKAKGITSEQDTLRELGLVFSNRTASQLFSTMFLQMANIKKNEALNRGAMGIDALDKAARDSLAGKELEMHKKWADVLRELGTTILPIAIKAVEGLTSILKSVVSFGEHFPRLTAALTVAFGVLGGLVAAGGAVMLTTAAFKALGLALTVSGGGTLASALMATAAGLKALSGVALAFAGGYAAGSAIYDALPQENKDRAGRNIAGILAFFGNKEAKEAIASEDKYIRSQQQAGQTKTGHIYMDGRKVGEIVTGHQARAAAMPTGGTTGFDGGMHPRPVGANGNW